MIPTAEEKNRRKLFQELVDSGFYYMRMHNHPDELGTPFRRTHSKKRFTKAVQTMMDFLEGRRVVVMPPKRIKTYTVTSAKKHKLVHLIDV